MFWNSRRRMRPILSTTSCDTSGRLTPVRRKRGLEVASFSAPIILVIVLGAFCILAEWRGPASLDLTLSVGQILQSLVLLAICFLVNHYYSRANDSRRMEVRICDNVAEQVSNSAREAHQRFAEAAGSGDVLGDQQLRTDLVESLRRYGNSIKTLDEVVGGLQLKDPPSIEAIREDRERYRDLTNDPFPLEFPIDCLRRESSIYEQIQRNITMFRLKLVQSV